MTREKAKSRFEMYVEVDNYSKMDLSRFIDKIYDDFENRTCESCKYFEADMWESNRGTCRSKDTPFKNFMVDYDYGCNKYETKEIK